MNDAPLTERAAALLRDHADDIIRRWIEWVRTQVGTATIDNLSYRALENHVPPAIAALADYVRDPYGAIGTELVDHLRMHGRIRLDQGYSVEELIGEFNGLAAIVTSTVRDELSAEIERSAGDEVATVFIRLASGFRLIHGVVLETYNESESSSRRVVAGRLAQFAEAVSHDLRNPLVAIRMVTDAMRRDPRLTPMTGRHLSEIDGEITRILALLDTLNTFTLSEGAWAGERLVLVSDVVSRTIDELAESAGAKDITIRTEGELPPVKIQSVAAHIAIGNVLTNAVKYADPEKDERLVVVTAELLDQPDDTGFVQITVRDNGIGIPPHLLPRVTQRGFRAHPGVSYGTGFGLHLVDATLSERGGALEIESAEGEWTEVRLRLRCITRQTESLLREGVRTVDLMADDAQPDVAPNDPPPTRPR